MSISKVGILDFPYHVHNVCEVRSSSRSTIGNPHTLPCYKERDKTDLNMKRWKTK